MQVAKFLKNKIRRQLKTNGFEFEFIGKTLNEYNELVDDSIKCNIIGIYHESNSYETEQATESSVTHTKPTPMILCLYDSGKDISVGDYTYYNGQKLVVTAKNDIQKFNVAFDISLKEV